MMTRMSLQLFHQALLYFEDLIGGNNKERKAQKSHNEYST